MKNVFCAILMIFFLFQKVSGQQDTISTTAHFPGNEYKKKALISGESSLYNGFEYINYPFNYFKEGHQFYGNGTWNIGTVTYEGITYSGIPILYDLIKDELIIMHFDKISKINLIKSKVQRFSIGERKFISQNEVGDSNSSTARFYEELYSKSITILAKRDKKIAESVSQGGVSRAIYEFTHYYIQKDGKWHSFKSKSSLVNILGDKKSEIQKYLKGNKLNFNKNPEAVMVKIATYYDQK